MNSTVQYTEAIIRGHVHATMPSQFSKTLLKPSRPKHVSFEARQSTVYAAALRWQSSNRDGFSAQKEFNVAPVGGRGKKPTEVTGELFPERKMRSNDYFGGEKIGKFRGNFSPRKEHLQDKKEMFCKTR